MSKRKKKKSKAGKGWVRGPTANQGWSRGWWMGGCITTIGNSCCKYLQMSSVGFL